MKLIIALFCGLLFGAGLTVSQMVDPQKVINFLSITSNWDASLIFVMGGALAVFAGGYFAFIKKRSISLLGEKFSISANRLIDKPLLFGAVIFGLGWGISGICPGPALANISAGEPKIYVFILVMVIGMRVSEFIKSRG